jgi:hypothetical protein
MLWMVLFMPFALILMALAIDGMSMAATYQRAMGLAKVAAQSGVTEVRFGGGQPTVSPQACQRAIQIVRANAPSVVAGPTGNNTVQCAVTNNVIRVLVRLKVFRMFTGPLSIPFDTVAAVASAEPRFGINDDEP